ncbi:MAG TPA: hypothetical protein VN920_04760 [Pyrinomonadaceae bacterium]|nr:hypothetical protein [Pyrinomonadaceae bacterium]
MKLVHALIAKSLAETILVATLGIVFYLSAFPPYFHGWGEVSSGTISGWVVDHSAPSSRVQVQFFIDGNFAATATANQSRPDVVNSGWASDEWHGYRFSAPLLPAGVHEVRVYALHSSGGGIRQSLQLVGDPISFLVDANGRLIKAEETSLSSGSK